jgi:hypothetical protein
MRVNWESAQSRSAAVTGKPKPGGYMGISDRRNILKSGLVVLGGGMLADVSSLAALQKPKAGSAPSKAAAGSNGSCNCDHAADGTLFDIGTSELRPMIERSEVDLRDITRLFSQPGAAIRRKRLETFYAEQFKLLDATDFDALSQSGKVDYLLFRNNLQHAHRQLEVEDKQDAEIAPLVAYQAEIIGLEEARRRMETLNAQKAAGMLTQIVADIAAAQSALAKGTKPSPTICAHAATRVNQLRGTLRVWFNFYDIYDPQFSWWCDAVYKQADTALGAHLADLLKAAGITPPEGGDAGGFGGRGGGGRGGRGGGGGFAVPAATGDTLTGIGPAGRDALIEALRYNMIPYTPEDLIKLANLEFAWCDKEMLRASNEMGFGNDWKNALEKVKNDYADPGKMIYLVRDLQAEAMKFIEERNLVTIPPLLKEDWWEEAMTPQMQLVNPFFTGGDTIQVSSPASTQTYEERLEVMRGNNTFFSRDTVFHELIPGHHMQGYMSQRYRAYRRAFSTAFWSEGMAFYWEMLMWDLGFTNTPEQRVGALFWRMHRCARIIFSLNFHLGNWTAKQSVDFLIERVGHERANAEGEVRRSFNGSYEPIYQCAYMLGALQFHSLHKELVDSGKMTNLNFHDALYREGDIPVEMIRAAVANIPLKRDWQTNWKFYGPLA